MRHALRRENNVVRGSPSFTLLELLVVIALLAVLAAVTVVVIQPAELLKRSRDTARTNDLGSIHRALAYLSSLTSGLSFGTSNTVYISVPDPALAAGQTSACPNMGLPALPSGWSYRCVSQADLRKINGAGWIPVDFTQFPGGAPLSVLPIDPVNEAASGRYYTYVTGGSWELTALFESEKQSEKAAKDGGVDPAMYEVGTNLKLSPFVRGLVGYWSFDEGQGTTAYDASGFGNNGTLTNGPTWVDGKVGKALSFDGVDDYVSISISSVLNVQKLTVLVWSKPSTNTGCQAVVSRGYCNGEYQIFVPASGCGGGSNGFFVHIAECSGGPRIGNSNTVTANAWHMFGLSYDGSVEQAWLNGQRRNSASWSGTISYLSTGLCIGCRSGSYLFSGLIDEVRIYNRALSAAEIKAIYDAAK